MENSMEVGIDILDIDRMEHLIKKQTFLTKFFHQKEIDYINTCTENFKPQILAGYYSCKEAFLKALGLGIGRGIDLKDICVQYTEFGKPYLELSSNALKIFKNMGFNNISCNISDSKNVVVAICIVY